MDADSQLRPADNQRIAQWLREAAELLRAQGANPFRVAAYRRASDTVSACPRSLRALLAADGPAGLDALPGIGTGISAAIVDMLDRSSVRGSARSDAVVRMASEPGVATLLDVDGEYLRKAASNSLPTIAPRRFNPGREAWLPVLHTQRGDWHFTALFSNTARAHELGRTRDWVVIFFYDSDHVERQRTVVTEQRGHLRGRRVVRGREAQCASYYEHRRQAAEPRRQALCDDTAI